jgi:hypothetical protein
MTWRFDVVAIAQRRLLSRILQVLDTQMVDIHSFTGEITEESVSIRFSVSSEQDKAHRIEALLYRLEGVRSVSIRSPVQYGRVDGGQPL